MIETFIAALALAFQGALYVFGTLGLLCLSLCLIDAIVAKAMKWRRKWTR